MTLQITLIGLGRIGVSLGLALKRQAASAGLKIVGHDRDHSNAKAAQARGAVDTAEWNLPAACDAADAIFLCLPASQLESALQDVAANAKAGCVVTDTAPLKGPVMGWAAASLPADRHYVGGAPILSPAQLHDNATGADAARADLFERGLWALVPDADAPPEALKLVSDLARLAGATPFFVGALELDALMAGIQTLPHLSAAGLMQAVAASPDWPDGRKLADRGFATATAPLSFHSPAAVRAEALLNSANVLRLLDAQLAGLTAMRQAIAAGDSAALEAVLTEAALAREGWLARRLAADWEAEELPRQTMPSVGSMLRNMIGLGRRNPPEDKEQKK